MVINVTTQTSPVDANAGVTNTSNFWQNIGVTTGATGGTDLTISSPAIAGQNGPGWATNTGGNISAPSTSTNASMLGVVAFGLAVIYFLYHWGLK